MNISYGSIMDKILFYFLYELDLNILLKCKFFVQLKLVFIYIQKNHNYARLEVLKPQFLESEKDKPRRNSD